MLVLYIILGILAAFLILALTINRDLTYEKRVLINAPHETVWQNISSLRAVDQWSPWGQRDPNMDKTFTGEDGAIGSQLAWESKMRGVGVGRQKITAIDPGKRVNTELEFIKPRTGLALGYLTVAEVNGAIEVAWGFTSKLPFPFNAMKLFINFEKAMDKDFGEGLAALKAICEGK